MNTIMKRLGIILSILLAFTACNSDKLTNKKAERIIKDYLVLQPLYETRSFLTGKDVGIFEDEFNKLQALEKEGYLTLNIKDTIPTDNLGNKIECDFTMEEKTNPYILKTLPTAIPIQNRPIVTLFRCEFDSIKEIRFIDAYPGEYARIFTRFKITDKTPFSIFYKDTMYVDKVISLTFNDGVWSFNNYMD